MPRKTEHVGGSIRRSDRPRKESTRARSPYEQVRYAGPKKKRVQNKVQYNFDELVQSCKAKQEVWSRKIATPHLISAEQQESELTGFIDDKKHEPISMDGLSDSAITMTQVDIKPELIAVKSEVSVPQASFVSISIPQINETGNSNHDNDDDIQIIGEVSPQQMPPVMPFVTRTCVPENRPPRDYEAAVKLGHCKMVTGARDARFFNCDTERPGICIQVPEFPDYDNTYIAENQCWNGVIRFKCVNEVDERAYCEIDPQPDGSFRIYEFGPHRSSCGRRSKGFECDKVRFIDGLLYLKLQRIERCIISEDRQELTINQPRGQFYFRYSHDVDAYNGALYTSECGCQAACITTPTAVWINFFHDDVCPVRSLTVAFDIPTTRRCNKPKPLSSISTASKNTSLHSSSSSSSSSAVSPATAIPISRSTVSRMIDMSQSAILQNSRWLASLSQYHSLAVEGHVAHTYWDRVNISRTASKYFLIPSQLGVLSSAAAISHLLIGSDAGVEYFENFFKQRFLASFDIIKLFGGVDYRKYTSKSPLILQTFNSKGYNAVLLQFAAIYFEFRMMIFKKHKGFERYGNWYGDTTPLAVLNDLGNGQFEIVIGMYAE